MLKTVYHFVSACKDCLGTKSTKSQICLSQAVMGAAFFYCLSYFYKIKLQVLKAIKLYYTKNLDADKANTSLLVCSPLQHLLPASLCTQLQAQCTSASPLLCLFTQSTCPCPQGSDAKCSVKGMRPDPGRDVTISAHLISSPFCSL